MSDRLHRGGTRHMGAFEIVYRAAPEITRNSSHQSRALARGFPRRPKVFDRRTTGMMKQPGDHDAARFLDFARPRKLLFEHFAQFGSEREIASPHEFYLRRRRA